MNAIWVNDYDYQEDKCFKAPGCPECREPIWHDSDGKYYCLSCGKEVTVEDPEMIKWIADRDEVKIVMEDCPIITSRDGKNKMGCGGKNCMEVHYRKNKVTLQWQTASGYCKNCGASFIV